MIVTVAVKILCADSIMATENTPMDNVNQHLRTLMLKHPHTPSPTFDCCRNAIMQAMVSGLLWYLDGSHGNPVFATWSKSFVGATTTFVTPDFIEPDPDRMAHETSNRGTTQDEVPPPPEPPPVIITRNVTMKQPILLIGIAVLCALLFVSRKAMRAKGKS